MKKRTYMLGASIILGLVATFTLRTTTVSAEIQPTVEVKYNLDPTIFQKDKIEQTFSATKDKETRVYFFDTAERTFFANNYIQRLRVYKGKNTYDITYKKRFQTLSIPAAIDELEKHGFTGEEKNYKFEIDSKNGQDPLSVSRKEELETTKKITYKNVEAKAAINALQENAPKKIKAWDSSDWFTKTAAASELVGPAEAKSYVGTYQGQEAEINYWEYQGKVMVELSTKVAQANADEVKKLWSDKLQQEGYISEDQRGKTNFVLFAE